MIPAAGWCFRAQPLTNVQGATEHAPTFAEDKISLDDVIATFDAIVGITGRAEKILAAAITLRYCSGRGRLNTMRNTAATWNVARYEVVDNTLKNRSVSALAKDAEAAVCDAALKRKSDAHLKVSDSKTRGSAEHMDNPTP